MMEYIESTNTTIDVMKGASRWHQKIAEHGFIDLVDVMPRLVPEGQTVDSAIVQAARVSYGPGTKKTSEDRGLIRYLMRHRHTTPFEMVELKFHVSLPIFVARQWIRHRTASVNEMSGRYSVLPGKFFKPNIEEVRSQSKQNKQGRDEQLDDATATEFLKWLDQTDDNYAKYEEFVDEYGVAREMARVNLPVSIYTEWYWKIDLHNLLHFLSLRMDKHAQKEIQEYANAMFNMVQEIAPVTAEAFIDYRLEGLHLSRLEIESLRNGTPSDSMGKREIEEWRGKIYQLGLGNE